MTNEDRPLDCPDLELGSFGSRGGLGMYSQTADLTLTSHVNCDDTQGLK